MSNRQLTRRRSRLTPQQQQATQAQLDAVNTLIASGVEGAGYGDKRTEFRSLVELRQIANALEDALSDSGGRIRQIRMYSPSDKGL